MAQLFLFTGENEFALQAEKRRWIKEFAEKHRSENLSRLEDVGLKFRDFLDEISVAPFIAEKRLVLISGVPVFSREEMQAIDKHAHEACVIAFFDSHPDKRLSGVKELLKIANVKEFTVLTGKTLHLWVASVLNELGASITDDAKQKLLELVGEDQMLLAEELKKLSLYANKRSIEAADVELLVLPSDEKEVWTMTNLLAAGKTKEALAFVHGQLALGTSPHSLWPILLWMLENLVIVTSSVREAKQTNPAKIAQYGVPFPSARTLLPLAQKVDPKKLRVFLQTTVAADMDLKTGGYRATAEAPEELIALIDRFIVQCGRLT
ncbi:DNA polymerase III subunit delta [Candidatus Peribacteria bacterium RIFCSPHIGHO2_02_FULL_52_16]|nr:MAG: DNA polymerase III subunit delta [Candidatus Peribacteria bacterium RIFCSPHIGHO2_01_FULL_51_35]OGJ61216.1 MAG: DNA polymerase III subunit delta [Candidatus Peribacteria bacterium RIFCSPHIGHO2_02_FULL_52_16]